MTLDIFQKHPFDFIAMTPVVILVLCCFHIAQLINQPAFCTLPFTLQFMLQASWHTAEGNLEAKCSYVKLWCIAKTSQHLLYLRQVPKFSQIGIKKQEFPYSPINILRTIKKIFLGIWESISRIKWGGGSRNSHSKTHCGHTYCNKNFQILPASDVHRLVDDANENHNYIACLFNLRTAHSDISFDYLNCFSKQKFKKKIESTAEFSAELKFETRKD